MSCFLKANYVIICLVGDLMIKEYRLKRGFTQEQLAEMLDISWRQLQRIEKNENKTKISTLKKIIKILNIPDNDIVKFMSKL